VFDAYATRWLLLDLVAVAPWDVLVAALAISKGRAPAALLLKVAKLPRLLRLRLFAVSSGERERVGAASAVARVGTLMAGFLILAHWGACMMWSISRAQVEYAVNNGISGSTGLLPMALIDHRRGVTYSPSSDAAQALVRGCAIATIALLTRPDAQRCTSRTLPGLALPAGSEWTLYCADLPTKYVAMAYYALTTLCTVGYGDFAPGTNMERGGAIFMEMMGCIACAVVFGNMAMLLHMFDQAGARLADRLQRLQRLCAHYRVPSALAQRAKRTCAELWRMQRGLDMEVVWDAVPENLHGAVLLHLYGGALRSSPLLAGAPEKLLKVLAERMQPCACVGGDTLGGGSRTPLPALLFVRSGRLTLRRGGEVLRALGAGETMGEDALVSGASELGDDVHLHCEEKCHLLLLPAADLEEVLHATPEVRKELRAKALEMLGSRKGDTKAAAPAGADEEAEEADDGRIGDLLALDNLNGVGGPLALRLQKIRKAAAASQRLLSTRLGTISATYSQLDGGIDDVLSRYEEAGRQAWLTGSDGGGDAQSETPEDPSQ